MLVSRDRSHQLPQNKKLQGGAKAELSKDIEPCGVWHLLRMEGGICACRGGGWRGVSFIMEKPCIVWLLREERT